ncbi:hypothetical protein JCM5350_003639 [Sporobolomyces pararoseus]
MIFLSSSSSSSFTNISLGNLRHATQHPERRGRGEMSTALLLTLYVTVDTTRALLVFGALHSRSASGGVELSPSLLTFAAEAFKLFLIAIPGVLITTPKEVGRSRFLLNKDVVGSVNNNRNRWETLRPYTKFAIPAALYGTNNVLYFTGLKITSPALLQVCVLSKLPLTALLHHLVIKRRYSKRMWYSLTILSFGLILAGSPQALWNPDTKIEWSDLISGPVIGLTVGIVSACSSVYTELALKENNVGFWQAQTYLYFWGTLFTGFAALISYLHSSPPPIPPLSTTSSSNLSEALPAFSLIVTITALTGLIVALILRQKDNLVKLVGSSLCITTVFVLQHLVFPKTDGLDFRTSFGIGVLTLATWTYNHYKEIGDDGNNNNNSPPPPSRSQYSQLSTNSPHSEEEEDDENSSSSSSDKIIFQHNPDTPSSSFSSESPIFPPTTTSTLSTTGTSNGDDLYTPTPTRLLIGFSLVLLISTLTSLQPSTTTTTSSERDLMSKTRSDSSGKGQKEKELVLKDLELINKEQEKEEENIGIASWIQFEQEEEEEEEGTTKRGIECLSRRGGEEEDSNLSIKTMNRNGCKVFPLPDQGLITHVFWSGERWRIPSFELLIDSWLATQDLTTNTNNHLIWWYESTNEPPSSFMDTYSESTFKNFITFKKFNESLITNSPRGGRSSCLSEMKEWIDTEYRKEIELPEMTRKSLIKLWILEQFGGVWLGESDLMVLRDFRGLERLGPSILSNEGNGFIDDSLMISGPDWGSTGEKMMKVACQLPFQTRLLIEKFPGLRLKAGPVALYTEGVVRLCEQEQCGLTLLPTSFVSIPPTVSTCQPFPTKLLKDHVVEEFFTQGKWIWKTGMLEKDDSDPCWSYGEEGGVEEKSLLSLMKDRVEKVLKERIEEGDWRSRELFTRETRVLLGTGGGWGRIEESY